MATYVERATAGLIEAITPPLAALSFLTVLPVPSVAQTRDGVFGRAVAYFPLVGTLLGGIVAGGDAACGLVLPRPVVTVLDLVAFALLTGGLHLDGLLDSCDGLLGGHDRERRLAIMRDSRVGSFGVLGGALILLLEFAALATLTEAARAEALVLAPTLARWAMALDVWAFPYARAEGHGTAFKAGLSRRHVVMATAWAGLVAAGRSPACAVAAPRDRPAGARPRPLDPRAAGRLDRRQLRGRERVGHCRDVRGPLGEVVMTTPEPAGPAPRARSVCRRKAVVGRRKRSGHLHLPPPASRLLDGRPEKGAPRGA